MGSVVRFDNSGNRHVLAVRRWPAIAAVAALGLLAACAAEPTEPTARSGAAEVLGTETAPDVASSTSPAPSTTAATASTPVAATPVPAAATPAAPAVTRKIVVETRRIPFGKSRVRDSTLKKGKTVIRVRGVNGSARWIYQVTVTGGVRTGKRLMSRVVTRPPTTQVTAIGTKTVSPPAGNCDPNYSGKCVPIASDVDCAGGSGNGPAFVTGPVRVVGSDVYDLDRDGDGVGCD